MQTNAYNELWPERTIPKFTLLTNNKLYDDDDDDNNQSNYKLHLEEILLNEQTEPKQSRRTKTTFIDRFKQQSQCTLHNFFIFFCFAFYDCNKSSTEMRLFWTLSHSDYR